MARTMITVRALASEAMRSVWDAGENPESNEQDAGSEESFANRYSSPSCAIPAASNVLGFIDTVGRVSSEGFPF